jgi:DNA-binding NtrC family response regulator
MPRLRRLGVPVVVLGAERGAHSAANAGGAVGVLCKPVTDTKLLAVVRRHCGPPREQQGGSADANL